MDASEPRIERSPKRIRVYFAGELVADTRGALLVWEIPYYPAYYLPLADVRVQLHDVAESGEVSPLVGRARRLGLQVGEHAIRDAARQYPEAPVSELREMVRFDWDVMDAWFEEDEQVYIHPRAPDHRLDVLRSSRHVEVVVEGVTVADSRSPVILIEPQLPIRYYLPPLDVRQDLLRPSATITGCPYKGRAEYRSLMVGDSLHEDLVWTYPAPVVESAKIAGLLCFFNERVHLRIDGESQPRPRTPFSRPDRPAAR